METEVNSRIDAIASERDKRRSARHSTRDMAIVTIGRSDAIDAGSSYPVQLQDLSARGCRFIGRLPLNRGDHFVLYLTGETGRIALVATAVHAVARPDKSMSIGAEFLHALQKPSTPSATASADDAELARMRAAMFDA